MPFKVIQSHRF